MQGLLERPGTHTAGCWGPIFAEEVTEDIALLPRCGRSARGRIVIQQSTGGSRLSHPRSPMCTLAVPVGRISWVNVNEHSLQGEAHENSWRTRL